MSEALLPEPTEEFAVAVTSPDVVTANREMWETLERFLGVDPVEAWTLVEVVHTPERDEQGRLTGLLNSSAKWARDVTVETPPNIKLNAAVEETA